MSTLEVNKITPQGVATEVTLGDSGDTFTIPSGVTLTNNGTANNFSDCVLISSTSMSGTATAVNITSGIDSTYTFYRFYYINVSVAGAGNTLFMRISSDGGSSFISSGYKHTGFEANYTGGSTSSAVQGATGFVQLGNNIPNYGDNTTEGACGYVEFYTPSVSRKPVFTGLSSQFSDNGDADAYYWGGYYGTATTFDAIQIGASNNIYGTLKLYGYK
jgi:hypothetical protein